MWNVVWFRTAIKVLIYDSQGFWLCHKRLSSGRFAFWPDGAQPTRTFEACELQLLLMGGATPSRFAEMKAGAHSFTDLGAFTFWENITLSGASEPEVLGGVHVSASFLRILGVAPLLGREELCTLEERGQEGDGQLGAE